MLKRSEGISFTSPLPQCFQFTIFQDYAMFSNCNDFNHDVFKLQITMFQIAMPSTTMFQMANANGKWQMQMANLQITMFQIAMPSNTMFQIANGKMANYNISKLPRF